MLSKKYFFVIGFVFSLIIPVFFVISGGAVNLVEWSLFSLYSVDFVLPILFDFYRVIFCFVVLVITFGVLLFSEDYMFDDINYGRFLNLVIVFVFSMLLLIFIPRLVALLIG